MQLVRKLYSNVLTFNVFKPDAARLQEIIRLLLRQYTLKGQFKKNPAISLTVENHSFIENICDMFIEPVFSLNNIDIFCKKYKTHIFFFKKH